MHIRELRPLLQTITATMVYQESIQETKLRKGPWLEEEDERLTNFVSMLGERKWDSIARVSSLNRSGKSCRLRWLNYLRPNLKRGHISSEEEQMIIQLHELWGNKWSKIARRLPGRTDNEIKNYWRTHLRKRIQPQEEGNFQCRVNDAEADFLFPKGNAGSWKYNMEDYELSNLGNLNSPYETRISDWMPDVSGHGSEVKNHEEYCNGLNSCFCYGPSNSEDSDNSTLDCSVGSLWDMSYLHC